MHVIEGTNADAVWLEAAHRIHGPEATVQSSRGGETRELLHCCLVLKTPVDRWVLNRRPAINPAFALAEVVWIISGRDDSGFLNYWNPKLPSYSGYGPLYYGAYGHRLRYRHGIDQIRHAFETLRAAPDSRQVVLQIWDAASDLPIDGGKPRGEDIPCNVCSLLKVRAGRLEWVQVMRSNDLKLGWPHNVVQFTTLQEMMAGWLGVEPGTYTHFSDSLHLYGGDHEELAEPSPLTLESNTDRWDMTYDETMRIVGDLGRRMDAIRSSGGIEPTMRHLALHDYGVPAATNALAVIAADAARRAGAVELEAELAARCSNPILRQLWQRWCERQRAVATLGDS